MSHSAEFLRLAGDNLRRIGANPVLDARARRLVDEAVMEVGRAIYGRNAADPRAVRAHARSAMALIRKAETRGGPRGLAGLGGATRWLRRALEVQ